MIPLDQLSVNRARKLAASIVAAMHAAQKIPHVTSPQKSDERNMHRNDAKSELMKIEISFDEPPRAEHFVRGAIRGCYHPSTKTIYIRQAPNDRDTDLIVWLVDLYSRALGLTITTRT